MHIRLFMTAAFVLLASAQGGAQQIGEYPGTEATMEPGAYVCKSKEALLLTLGLLDHSLVYSSIQFVPPPRGCHMVLTEVEVSVTFVEVFVGENFSADILAVEFKSGSAMAGERYFVQGEERMLVASV